MQDEKIIEKLHNEIIAAFNAYDVERLLAVHTDDIILMEPNRPIISGKAEVRQIFTKAFGNLKQTGDLFKLSFKICEMEIWGNRAFARGQVFKITRDVDESTKEEQGKYLCLFKKQQDGSWLRSHVIANVDGPVKTEGNSLFKE